MADVEAIVEVVGAFHHVGAARLAVIERHHARHAALIGQVGIIEGNVKSVLRLGDELRAGEEIDGVAVIIDG